MTLYSVLSILAILGTVSEVINGCETQAARRGDIKHAHTVRKNRDLEGPIFVGESEFGIVLRPRSSNAEQMDIEAERLFRRIDTNGDNVVDSAEWVDFSTMTSIWDFVTLLDYANLDDDEVISSEEFVALEVVKIDQLGNSKEKVAGKPS